MSTPQFFLKDTLGLNNWNQYLAKNKRKLREYILENEQHELCCYCEGNVSINSANQHLEHIVPRISDISLIFDYNNILVSCNGKHFN